MCISHSIALPNITPKATSLTSVVLDGRIHLYTLCSESTPSVSSRGSGKVVGTSFQGVRRRRAGFTDRERTGCGRLGVPGSVSHSGWKGPDPRIFPALP